MRLRAIKAHHTHNKPPSTMLATTTLILPTTQNMNSSYSMACVPQKLCPTPLLPQCSVYVSLPHLFSLTATDHPSLHVSTPRHHGCVQPYGSAARGPTEALQRHIYHRYHRPDCPNYIQVAPQSRVALIARQRRKRPGIESWGVVGEDDPVLSWECWTRSR